MQDVKTLLQENTALTKKVADETQQLRILWSEARSAFSLFNRIVSSIRWCVRFLLVPMAVLLVVVYALRHDGKVPTWFGKIWDIWWDGK